MVQFQAEITGGFGLASPIPDSLSFRATADPIEDASQLVCYVAKSSHISYSTHRFSSFSGFCLHRIKTTDGS